MSKLFTRLLRRAAAAALLCFSAASAYAASDGYVYVNDAWNDYYPVVENADYYKDSRIAETSPGSKIYEGVITLRSGEFSCYTELADLPDGVSQSISQYMNVIMPANAAGDVPLNKLGDTDVYFTDNVLVANSLPKYNSMSRWYVPAGEYFIRLDLNTKRLYLMDSSHHFALINSNVAPTFDTLDKFKSLKNIKEYVEAGDLRMRFYDLATRQWLNPAAGYEEVTGDYLSLDGFKKSETMGQPVAWPGWPGGVVSGNGNYAVSFDCDDNTKMWRPVEANTVCAVGDFCSWDLGTCLTAVPVDNKATFTLPAGATQFKFTLGSSWDDPLGSLEIKETLPDNSTVLYLSRSGASPNITFTTPLGQDTEVTVSLADGTVHFPAGVSVFGFEKSELNADKDEYYVEIAGGMTPWSGASDAVRNAAAGRLTKNSDGTYSGYAHGLKGKAFRIISKLAPKGGNNNVIAPAAGMEKTLRFASGDAQSSASNLTADNSGWWRLPDGYDARYILVAVTPGTNPVVSFANENDPDRLPDKIYLIGSPNGWVISDSSMPLLRKADGNYYGAYEIASDDIFRFYKSLGSWDSGSMGSQYLDNPISISMESGDYQGSWEWGKGSWQFSDWAGGTMYMCVTPGGRVRFSDSPIPEGTPDAGSDSYMVYANNRYYKMYKKADGVFYASAFLDSGFRLFSKALGLTQDEPQWSGSYALSAPSSDFCFSLDEFGVGEASYTHQNDLNTKGGNMFRVPEGIAYGIIVLDTNVGKVYVETSPTYYPTHRYIFGLVSDNMLPTYENRDQFKNLHYSNDGLIVDIPAGKFDLSLSSNIINAEFKTDVENVEFNDMVACSQSPNGYGYDKRFACADWTGGKVFISGTCLVDLRTIDRIYLYDYAGDTEKITDLKRIGTDGLLFEGDVDFDENNPSAGFIIRVNKPVAPTYISLGVGAINKNTDKARMVFTPKDFAGGTMKVNFELSQFTKSMKFESLKGKGKIHVKVDLIAGTLQMSLPEANLGEFIESHVDGNADLNGIVGTPSKSREDAFVWSGTIVNPSAEGYDLSFISSNGNVIRPMAEGITNVAFNEDGLWTGSFTTVGSPDKATAVTTAASSAKWHIAPEAVTNGITALVDNKTGKITFHSSSSMQGYFITGYYRPCIDEIEQVSENMLRKIAPGIYEGELMIEEQELTQPDILRSFHRNIYDNNPSDNTDYISTTQLYTL